jgi:hypothetical protein
VSHLQSCSAKTGDSYAVKYRNAVMWRVVNSSHAVKEWHTFVLRACTRSVVYIL